MALAKATRHDGIFSTYGPIGASLENKSECFFECGVCHNSLVRHGAY